MDAGGLRSHSAGVVPWPQDAFATLGLPYTESVTDAGGKEVLSITANQGQLICRALVLPSPEPGQHQVIFERLRGDALSYHKLFRDVSKHMQLC